MRFGFVIIILFSVLPSLSTAQTSVVVGKINNKGYRVIDITTACANQRICNIKTEQGSITITGFLQTGRTGTTTTGGFWRSPLGWAGTPSDVSVPYCPTVISDIPIIGILIRSIGALPTTYNSNLSVLTNYVENASPEFYFPSPVKQFKFDCGLVKSGVSIVSIAFASNNPKYLSHALTSSSTSLFAVYEQALVDLNQLTGSLKRSDRPHMDRLKSSIQSAMDAFVMQNNVPTVPVTHQNILESARMTVAMGTVMEEIFNEYDDIESTQQIITNIRELVNQLRVSFGWTNGLVGAPSKAMAAISVVLETVLRETLMVKDATDSNVNRVIYTQLRFKAMALKAAVRGRAGGDASASKEVQAFAADWNSQAWQNELHTLINAGKDTENNIQTKVKLLLMAVASLNDLTGVQFEEGLRYTPETKPVTPLVPVKKL
ncbi:MAG: hypothetical protein AB7F59_04740 [Bdellovibrionales bacterium]